VRAKVCVERKCNSEEKYQLKILWNESECGEETMREKKRRTEIKHIEK
jgi:hypothetical protein